MRQYPSNSPQAAARVLALALMADGAIDAAELSILHRRDLLARLGLDEADFDRVMQECCDDLLLSGVWTSSGQLALGEETVGAVLAEVQDSALRRCLLRAVLDIVNASGSLEGGEAVLVSRALKDWELTLREVADSTPASARQPH
ncbi:TerB family tellurite resistance protein [Zoogloea sp.]|uniref:TerB family tellurite resistance protein n=1 Tax=Zoogloea sp. TaxID=49181 RepID=UPI001A4FDB22|nr:TerB family tellurite resistance protein [Zoogloea sp.]